VATSLAAFALVYFTVFGAGVFYILRLMSKPPGGADAEIDVGPVRAAGITPAVSLDPDRALSALERRPRR
jgi:cytochrome d ubiquinol oxidase subunit I